MIWWGALAGIARVTRSRQCLCDPSPRAPDQSVDADYLASLNAPFDWQVAQSRVANAFTAILMQQNHGRHMNHARRTSPAFSVWTMNPESWTVLAVHLRRDYQVFAAMAVIARCKCSKRRARPRSSFPTCGCREWTAQRLLKHVRQLYPPETTRILLTGETGRDAAIAAVNEGQIFRFLTKPCPPDQLRSAIEAGVLHHRLLIAEKVLLQETFDRLHQGAGRHPRHYQSRCLRAGHAGVKRLATELAASPLRQGGFLAARSGGHAFSGSDTYHCRSSWWKNFYYGKRLTPEERVCSPDGRTLGCAEATRPTSHRLEQVMEILAATGQSKTEPPDGMVKLGAAILNLVLEYDAQIAQGHSADVAPVVRALRIPRDSTPS